MSNKTLDAESRDWRRIHREEIIKQINPFLARVFRKSESKNSVNAKITGILNLCDWRRKLPLEIIAEIKAGADPYSLLDDFVGYLSKIKASSFGIKNSVSSVRRFMAYSGFPLNSDTFRERVEMPGTRARTRDEPLTIERLRKIFVFCTSPTGKRLLAVLVSTGMRISEALQLRYSDINFETKPPRIFLPAERTKDRIERYCFLTDEAAQLIKESGLKDDDYLFPSSGRGRWKNHGFMSYVNANYIFQTALKKANLFKQDKFGRSVTTLHSIGKLTYSRLAAVIGKE